jgi:hypothetical protein
MRVRRLVRTLAVVLAVGGMWRLRRSGLGVRDVSALVRGVVEGSIRNLGQVTEMVRRAVLG